MDSASMRSLVRLLSAVALLVSTVWIVWYAYSNPGVIAAVRAVSTAHVAALAFLVLGIFMTNGLYTKVVISAYGRDLSLRESFLLSVATTAANYLLPGRSGAGLRGLYLKGRVGFDLVDFFITLSGLYVIALSVNGALGLLGIGLLVASGRPFDPWVAAVFAFAVLASVAIMAAPIRDVSGGGLVARTFGGWSRLRARPSLFVKLLAITIGQSLLMLCQTSVAFHAIDATPPLADVLFFTSLKSLALLTTITPGALGIVEWLSVYMAKHLAFSPEQAFVAQGLMRAVTISAALVMGPLAALSLGLAHRRRRVLGSERC
jgi:uncharacterized membrane protein YbhN (UPF0104 family)